MIRVQAGLVKKLGVLAVWFVGWCPMAFTNSVNERVSGSIARLTLVA